MCIMNIQLYLIIGSNMPQMAIIDQNKGGIIYLIVHMCSFNHVLL